MGICEKQITESPSTTSFFLRNTLFRSKKFVLFAGPLEAEQGFALILSRLSLILEKWDSRRSPLFPRRYWYFCLSVLSFSTPAATDCEMKFYIKLRLSSLLLCAPPSSSSVLTPASPFLSTPFSSPRANPTRSLYIFVPIDRYVGRLHIY